MRIALVCVAFAIACNPGDPSVSDSSTSTSASGGGTDVTSGGDDAGGGGTGDPSSSTSGSGGAPGAEPQPDTVITLDEPSTQVACSGSTVFWWDSNTREVLRLSGEDTTVVLSVPGDSEVLLRNARTGIIVVSLGNDGAAWLVTNGDKPAATELHSGPLLAAYIGNETAWWYDGESMSSSDGSSHTIGPGAVDVAIRGDSVYWITQDGSLFIKSDEGDVPTKIADTVDYYPRTLHAFGPHVAWGSLDGLMVLTDREDSPILFGNDVSVNAVADDGLIYCNQVYPDAAWVAMVTNELRRKNFASRTTCLSVARCGDVTYWSTDDGSIMSVSAPR